MKRAPLDISLSLEAGARGLFAVQVEEEEVGNRKRIKKKRNSTGCRYANAGIKWREIRVEKCIVHYRGLSVWCNRVSSGIGGIGIPPVSFTYVVSISTQLHCSFSLNLLSLAGKCWQVVVTFRYVILEHLSYVMNTYKYEKCVKLLFSTFFKIYNIDALLQLIIIILQLYGHSCSFCILNVFYSYFYSSIWGFFSTIWLVIN